MMDRSLWTLYICCATFVLVLLITVLIVYRGGRSKELATAMRAVEQAKEAVEEMRRQNSTEHYQFLKLLRWVVAELARLIERFGFLSRKDASEPPLPPTVKPEKGKTP